MRVGALTRCRRPSARRTRRRCPVPSWDGRTWPGPAPARKPTPSPEPTPEPVLVHLATPERGPVPVPPPDGDRNHRRRRSRDRAGTRRSPSVGWWRPAGANHRQRGQRVVERDDILRRNGCRRVPAPPRDRRHRLALHQEGVGVEYGTVAHGHAVVDERADAERAVGADDSCGRT